MTNQFNLRVYALLINEKNEILLSDEFEYGRFFTKFPGGGVEIGEGILDALHRELKEELNLELTNPEFFYFNDFYQQSGFNPKHQLVAFYYLIRCHSSDFQGQEYDFPFYEEGEKQRWISITELSPNELTFPVDKIAFNKLTHIIHRNYE